MFRSSRSRRGAQNDTTPGSIHGHPGADRARRPGAGAATEPGAGQWDPLLLSAGFPLELLRRAVAVGGMPRRHPVGKMRPRRMNQGANSEAASAQLSLLIPVKAQPGARRNFGGS